MIGILLQPLPQVANADAGLFENGEEQARAKHPPGVHGNRHAATPLWMPQLNVRAALDDNHPAEALEGADQLGAGETRQARHRPAA